MASNAENVSIWYVIMSKKFKHLVSWWLRSSIDMFQGFMNIKFLMCNMFFYEIINFNMADEIPRQPFAIQWATASDVGGFKPDVKQRHCEMEGFLQLSNQVWDQAYSLHNN